MKTRMQMVLATMIIACLTVFLTLACVTEDYGDGDFDDGEEATDSDSGEGESDGDSDTDSQTDTDTAEDDEGEDTDTAEDDEGEDTDTLSDEDFEWSENELFSIENQTEYDWAIKQRNVVVAFIDGESVVLDYAVAAAYNNQPWVQAAVVDFQQASQVFANAGVDKFPCLKFFSYGVEMENLTLDDENELTEEQAWNNARALMNRYNPDIIQPTNYEELENLLTETDTPVLIKFGATWCGPCMYMMGRLQIASIEYGNDLLDAEGNLVREKKSLTIIDVDIDTVPGMGPLFGFEAIPFFVFYNDGKRHSDMLGSRPYEVLKSEIDAFLASL